MNNLESNYVMFTGNIKFGLQVLEKAQKETDRLLATHFNIFDIINPNENKLSELFSILLAPNEKHGQGDIFLKLFMQILKDEIKIDNYDQLDFSTAKINTEFATSYIKNTSRRIDIVIEFENYNIAIENKPWACDQYAQLKNYAENMEKMKSKNFCLLYLTPTGKYPSKESIKKEDWEKLCQSNNAANINYNNFIKKWLVASARNCQSEKIRFFINDFISYIDKTFVYLDNREL